MSYNLPNQSQSTTLTADERGREARRLLNLLQSEGDDVLQSRLTRNAYQFVQEKLGELELLEEMGSKAELVVSTSQLFWLRDLWEKFV
jgi:hypothetical protein